MICRQRHHFFQTQVSSWARNMFIKPTCDVKFGRFVLLVGASDYNMFCFVEIWSQQKAIFQIAATVSLAIKQLPHQHQESTDLLIRYYMGHKRSSHTLSLKNLTRSVFKMVICLQHSRLYGVITDLNLTCVKGQSHLTDLV